MSAGNRARSIARRSRRAVPRAAISRATTSRGASSSVNRSPCASRQEGASPAQRLGEKERRVDERRGMELHELEVRERRSCAIGGRHPFPECARRVRRPLPERRRTARRHERGARDRASVGDHAHAPLVRVPEREHRLALGDPYPRVGENTLRKHAWPRGHRSRRPRRARPVSGYARPPGRGPRRTRRRARRDRGSGREPLPSTPRPRFPGTVRDRP